MLKQALLLVVEEVTMEEVLVIMLVVQEVQGIFLDNFLMHLL